MTNQIDIGARRMVPVLGTEIDEVSWEDALQRLRVWADLGESRIVAVCNAHSLVTAKRDEEFAHALSVADMLTPDGGSVSFFMRLLGAHGQERINGPDLMWRYCEDAEKSGRSVFFYGGSSDALNKLVAAAQRSFPALRIAGYISPPFRPMTPEENEVVALQINSSSPGVVWVGLGCPKQEKWMADNRGKINAVMVGVGAAFDYHAGVLRRAPSWMQSHGLEWVYRLVAEPRRLWKRYLITNSLFIWYAACQIAKHEVPKRPKHH